MPGVNTDVLTIVAAIVETVFTPLILFSNKAVVTKNWAWLTHDVVFGLTALFKMASTWLLVADVVLDGNLKRCEVKPMLPSTVKSLILDTVDKKLFFSLDVPVSYWT